MVKPFLLTGYTSECRGTPEADTQVCPYAPGIEVL
jgi:hypothetical protein